METWWCKTKHILTPVKKLMIRILSFVIKKVKNTLLWTYVLSDLKEKEIVGTFYKKELQKTNKKKFSIEKVIQRKGHKLHVKWKDYNNSFNRWIDKKEYFPEPKSSGARVKVDLDLSNYATKKDLKNAAGADTSKFAEKVDLASLKSTVDKLDIDKLKNVPRNLSNFKRKVDKLDDDKLVPVPVDLRWWSTNWCSKNDVVKKDVYNANLKKNTWYY